MSRREQIKMSAAEVRDFLEAERVAVVSTFGPRGWPHSMPLWFTVREAPSGDNLPPGSDPPPEAGGVELWSWTYARSQKVRNLERDTRATVLVEAGYDRYEKLRGVMIEAETVIHADLDVCAEFGAELFQRYAPGDAPLAPEALAAVQAQATKRVALQFRPLRLSTWDHRKLDGAY